MQKMHGFTLVELAIVMTIVGLLIGGVLIGMEQIMRAKVIETIEQVNAYRAATKIFMDKYSQPPGDINTARTRITGCNTESSCENGNGDSLVGDSNDWMAENNGITHERTQFWKHLALMDLISGINPSAGSNQLAWGQSHPASRFNGGFHIARSVFEERRRGHYLRMQGPVQGDPSPAVGSHAISPYYAAFLDRKMDDGHADKGFVWSSNATVTGDCDVSNNPDYPNGYKETKKHKLVCDLFIHLY